MLDEKNSIAERIAWKNKANAKTESFLGITQK
jgi:hypothetical protein